MLNLIATHSPRLAAMVTNRPYGEDIQRSPAILHRIALRSIKRARAAESATSMPAESLREQPARS
ncbi:MAG TPA: hypothetical protein PJ994_06885 [Tepidiformaceae bacterium]|mgnify:CR=1 FL=1|nr:hypothetical protein [Tepidiformaceae bacterium]